MADRLKSGRGLPQSKTLRDPEARRTWRSFWTAAAPCRFRQCQMLRCIREAGVFADILIYAYTSTGILDVVQQLLAIYRGLSHESRLRILLLLAERPLCVQQLQQILEMSQVEMSKQLAYLKACDLVQVEKLQNWRVYSLRENKGRELQLHLKCLQECTRTTDTFLKDRERLKGLAQAVVPKPTPRSKPSMPAEPLAVNEPGGLEDHLL